MRRADSTKSSHRLLKAIIILIVIVVAVLLITQYYLILVELAVCGLGGYIAYRVIKKRLENPRKNKIVELQKTRAKEIKQTSTNDDFDLSKLPPEILIEELEKVPSDILIKVLTDRGEVRIR